MADKASSSDDPVGVGAGVTGASGELIQGTGGKQGVGGTGERTMQDAAGNRPDERQNPSPQELENAAPSNDSVKTTRPSGVRNVTPANDREPAGRAHESGEPKLGGGSDREGG